MVLDKGAKKADVVERLLLKKRPAQAVEASTAMKVPRAEEKLIFQRRGASRLMKKRES